MPSQRPLNILWIQTDEQRTDSLGCYNPRVHTPHIDALSAQGTTFYNHHTQSPVCVPSRVCELTGRYPHQTGVLNNSVHYTWGTWPADTTSFPELFAQAGYVTANFGKYHTPHHPTWLENWHFEWFPEEASFTQLGEGFDPDAHEVMHIGHNPDSVILSGRYPYAQHGRTPQSYVVDHALHWLKMYAHVRRPYVLRVSFLAPHTPVLAPEPFYSLYDPADMDWDVPDEAVLQSRPHYELGTRGASAYDAHTDADFRRMRCTYYGLVAHIDQQVGRLLDYFEQSGQLENTLILYTADHGDLMGEYGQFQKGMFYDIVTRVPCMLAGPGLPSGVSATRLTECVDIAPTLLSLAGLPVPEAMVGRSMLTGEVREDVIGEIALRRGGRLQRRSWIRTARWSLDYTSAIDEKPAQSPEEKDGKLIDLVEDPLAHRNLYRDPAYSELIEVLENRFTIRTAEQRVPVQIGGNPFL
ncbi:MAG: sulfatase-like hydrolase/transferase, partial [Anaerolineae bacterium]|nr:sulfatase-like hydrolase/transferase [Anaerolineae bacterium]